jgi:hypothetical protein
MPKRKYIDINIGAKRLAVIEQANVIIEEYEAQGFDLTLRQLYYQFVSRGYIPNSQKEYKKLGDTINDARLAGLVDWLRITDRTRNLRSLSTWDDPADIVHSAAMGFRTDLWDNQSSRIEVWVEKDAITGVIEGVCNELRVPFFSCRGYTSQSEMWVAAQRLLVHRRRQTPVVIHLGDHDPSGIDMSRDIQDRLRLFMDDEPVEFVRIALNRNQVDEYHPPPNPAKTTDARYEGYAREHGQESWELDALEPAVIVDLIRNEVDGRKDDEQWETDLAAEEEMIAGLKKASARWPEVTAFLERKK